ncbi:hypothetical protein BU24DRAFT_458460 [Aaosphaeria arxii CBS 175.79]|uniref:Uncharacterized protein n=1 Tax=Aaosphaeria arxii CBS 175.79 TaxID=1450172 RepID=A0A6A5XZJ4_9PLEO|nr:uncharacterized protein BU24DRAFT_458460 [Aaosphaeria arxii CBS 175.79]KAF2018718.1 hypothetical protein BU24DRAFT_458460 [Aaosphaeria arxii CBS 175.79]
MASNDDDKNEYHDVRESIEPHTPANTYPWAQVGSYEDDNDDGYVMQEPSPKEDDDDGDYNSEECVTTGRSVQQRTSSRSRWSYVGVYRRADGSVWQVASNASGHARSAVDSEAPDEQKKEDEKGKKKRAVESDFELTASDIPEQPWDIGAGGRTTKWTCLSRPTTSSSGNPQERDRAPSPSSFVMYKAEDDAAGGPSSVSKEELSPGLVKRHVEGVLGDLLERTMSVESKEEDAPPAGHDIHRARSSDKSISPDLENARCQSRLLQAALNDGTPPKQNRRGSLLSRRDNPIPMSELDQPLPPPRGDFKPHVPDLATVRGVPGAERVGSCGPALSPSGNESDYHNAPSHQSPTNPTDTNVKHNRTANSTDSSATIPIPGRTIHPRLPPFHHSLPPR